MGNIIYCSQWPAVTDRSERPLRTQEKTQERTPERTLEMRRLNQRVIFQRRVEPKLKSNTSEYCWSGLSEYFRLVRIL